MNDHHSPTTLTKAAVFVLNTADPFLKATQTRYFAQAHRSSLYHLIGDDKPPQRPARPNRPILLRPGDMPRRRAAGSRENQAALLHALAHIELNAIDLAWDLIARFGRDDWPADFYRDWVKLADDEARHFLMLCQRLNEHGLSYGDLPAHDGLWQSATDTSHDVAARLAIVPLVLEARGLDVTPGMIVQFCKAGCADDAQVLEEIYRDEINHVAIGRKWFEFLSHRAGLDPASYWRDLVRRYFHGSLKPPFNEEARQAAGFWPESYQFCD